MNVLNCIFFLHTIFHESVNYNISTKTYNIFYAQIQSLPSQYVNNKKFGYTYVYKYIYIYHVNCDYTLTICNMYTKTSINNIKYKYFIVPYQMHCKYNSIKWFSLYVSIISIEL